MKMQNKTTRALARQLASRSIEQGDPIGWFEALYKQAQGDANSIPWADLDVNPNLRSWIENQTEPKELGNSLVIGCGLGDDVSYLVSKGLPTIGFDVSATAIDWCRQRFSNSSAEFEVADLFQPSTQWHQLFQFVFEAYTLQSLPSHLWKNAIEQIASFVAPGGTLLVVTRARNEDEEYGQLPWPLSRTDLKHFEEIGLRLIRFEDYFDKESPPVRRFRIEYRRESS